MKYNPYRFIIGHYRAFIANQHAKIFSHQRVQELIKIAASKHICVKEGKCRDCGCPIEEVLFSNKCKLNCNEQHAD